MRIKYFPNEVLAICQLKVCQLKIYLGLPTYEFADLAELMSYDNYTAKTEIALTIKKIHDLGLITFRSYSTFEEIQKYIKVLGPKTFRDYSTYSNESKLKSNQSRLKRKPGRKTRRRVGSKKMTIWGKTYWELSQVLGS